MFSEINCITNQDLIQRNTFSGMDIPNHIHR